MIRIGIVGHRFFPTPETEAFVSESCYRVLAYTKQSYHSVTAVSATAKGADTLFAELAITLGIPLEIICPFHKYIEDFTDARCKERYLRLKAMANKEINLKHQQRTDDAYSEAMNWVVENSDLLIAVWDGGLVRGKTGTAMAVRSVIDSCRDWIHIDTVNLTVRHYVKRMNNFNLPDL
jgi:hypothetical protein